MEDEIKNNLIDGYGGDAIVIFKGKEISLSKKLVELCKAETDKAYQRGLEDGKK